MKSFESKEAENLKLEEIIIEKFLTYLKPLELIHRYGNESLHQSESHELRQSVSEHMLGMMYLTDLVTEVDSDLTNNLDLSRVRKLVYLHDMHEGHLDDVILKDEGRKKLEEATDELLGSSFSALDGNNTVADLLKEYRDQSTQEAVFVKYVDRLEALLTMLGAGRFDKLRNREEDTRVMIEQSENISKVLSDTFKLAYEKLRARREEVGQGEFKI